MSSSENPLSPCPCCGEEVSCSAGFQNGYGTYYFIKCSCGLTLNGQFEPDVIARWNKRVTADKA